MMQAHCALNDSIIAILPALPGKCLLPGLQNIVNMKGDIPDDATIDLIEPVVPNVRDYVRQGRPAHETCVNQQRVLWLIHPKVIESRDREQKEKEQAAKLVHAEKKRKQDPQNRADFSERKEAEGVTGVQRSAGMS